MQTCRYTQVEDEINCMCHKEKKCVACKKEKLIWHIEPQVFQKQGKEHNINCKTPITREKSRSSEAVLILKFSALVSLLKL